MAEIAAGWVPLCPCRRAGFPTGPDGEKTRRGGPYCGHLLSSPGRAVAQAQASFCAVSTRRRAWWPITAFTSSVNSVPWVWL